MTMEWNTDGVAIEVLHKIESKNFTFKISTNSNISEFTYYERVNSIIMINKSISIYERPYIITTKTIPTQYFHIKTNARSLSPWDAHVLES